MQRTATTPVLFLNPPRDPRVLGMRDYQVQP